MERGKHEKDGREEVSERGVDGLACQGDDGGGGPAWTSGRETVGEDDASECQRKAIVMVDQRYYGKTTMMDSAIKERGVCVCVCV